MKPIKRALCAALCAALLLGLFTPASAADFTDVSSAHWAYSDVMWAKSSGIVEGVGDNKFAPGKNVSTAEMVKMLCGAFLSGEYQAYAAAHPGQGPYWYSPMAEFFEAEGLLKGIIITISSNESMTAPMSRYNMAEIITNVLAKKGVAATDAQKEAAKSQLGSPASFEDYHVQSAHEDAILNTYALGIINGIDGRFEGSQSMTRAQACAVLHRMSDLLGGTAPAVPAEPGPVATPGTGETPEPTVKEIQVSSENWSGNNNLIGGGQTSGNAWTITDNGFGDGYLNNGKPITEENVIELLHEAEKIWPAGMTWTLKGTGNNFYKSSGSVVSKMLDKPNTGAAIKESSNFACGGFSAMISDYIFGRDNNNFHRVTDMNDIRPGDIIIRIDPNTNTVVHVFMAVTAPGDAYTGLNGTTAVTRAGFFHLTDGNTSNKVTWPNMYSAPISKTNETEYTWQVYSRYPE